MDGGNAKRLSGTIAATPAALLVGRIQKSILPSRALLARRSGTLIVGYFISTRLLMLCKPAQRKGDARDVLMCRDYQV